jgi:hypothetical protein
MSGMELMNNISYCLNKNLSIDKIAQDLNKLLSQIPQEELKDCLLKISIQKISAYAGDSLLPKIEYKEQDSLT